MALILCFCTSQSLAEWKLASQSCFCIRCIVITHTCSLWKAPHYTHEIK